MRLRAGTEEHPRHHRGARPQLSTLSKLIKDAGLTDTLAGTGPFTVFAPTDEAFKAVPAATLDELAKDKERCKGC